MHANRCGFERYLFRARTLVDVSAKKWLCTPIILGPTSLAGLVAPWGEVLAAKAAASRGSLFTGC